MPHPCLHPCLARAFSLALAALRAPGIKVEPWQVFGTVELDIFGEDIVIEHVWAANVVEMEPLDGDKPGMHVKVELDNTPQDDQQFDIDGTGTPSVEPRIVGCENLEPVEADCKLLAKYSMLNSFEGTVSSKVHINTWQEGAKITVDFGDSEEVKISEAWGATVVDTDDDPDIGPNVVVFRLMPFNHHMPTDRRSCFGFDATPPFHHMPLISCVPSRPFPPPPPPSPPSTPPSPPPYITTERSDCFLGGRVTFVITPGEVPGMLWEANVKMERWLIGAQLTLNFFGDQLYAHPLRVASVTPPDAVSQVSKTAHSVVFELKNTPVHEFNLMAYGRVDSLSGLSCCCAEMPSPPPPPPMPPPSPSPPPQFPRLPPSMRETQMESEWGRGIIGSMDAPPPSPPPVLDHTEATSSGTATTTTALGTLGFAMVVLLVMRLVRILRDPMRFVPKPPQAKRGGWGGRRAEDGCTQPMMEADEESSVATTKLHIEASPEERCALKISMDAVDDMADLQDLVAEVCDEAGYRDLDDLVMTYKNEDGEYATVTRSVTIEMLKASPALRLAPANAAPKKKKKGKK